VERTTIAGETEVLGEILPQRHFVPPQISHDQVRFRTPDRSGGMPATNRLSYGAACSSVSSREEFVRSSPTSEVSMGDRHGKCEAGKWVIISDSDC
jgi:hypothetical protein